MYAVIFHTLDTDGPLIWLQICMNRGKLFVKLKQTRKITRDKIFSWLFFHRSVVNTRIYNQQHPPIEGSHKLLFHRNII